MREAWRSLAVVVIALVAPSCTADRIQPQRRVAMRAPSPGACATCHPSESAEWEASLHRASFTDADFQSSFQTEPLDFCVRCHAPLAAGRGDARGLARGVGCESCHTLAEGTGRRGHAATRGCAGCHEFAFPGTATLMQKTVAEHLASPFADVACATCHFPRDAAGHVDHRAHVARNEERLRASLSMRVRRTERGVVVDLVPVGVGHALPTGDLFRRLRVLVQAEDARGGQVFEREILLARTFDRGAYPPRELDTRLVGPRTLDVEDVDLAAASRVVVEVRHERVAQTSSTPDVTGRDARRERVFASVLLGRVELGSFDR